MNTQKFDVAVVGGGPGGYVAAIRAAQLGMRTALIERENLGGVCLNWGCIPTKALLRSAEVLHLLRHASAYGIVASDVGYDLASMVQRSRKIAEQLQRGVKHLLKKNQVGLIEGNARLAAPGKLTVAKDGTTPSIVQATNIVIATGARPRTLPGLEPDGNLVWTAREAMTPKVMPKKLLVVGSGAIGIEFASFYNTLGAQVTVVEAIDRILPVEDEEISSFARSAFEKVGITIHTGATITRLRKGSNSVTAEILAGGKTTELEVDRVIVAVGVIGNVDDLGLEGTRVVVEKGHIQTDAWGQTGESNIYAIGDVAGAPCLAHKASHEGILCVERIAGATDAHPLDPSRIPSCTYGSPQIASIGLTEKKAREQGHQVRIGRFPFAANGKAIALGEPDGLVKTVFDAATGELLGAHMVGPEVTEMIQGYGIAKSLETTEAELMQTVFPHPTLGETMHEAVLSAYGRAIHM